MADYFPLLARALDTLPERDPETRRAVYDRARAALVAQLRSVQPPLGEAELARETTALDEAITRAEEVYGAQPPSPPPAAPEPPEPAHAAAAEPSSRITPPPAIRRGGNRNRPLILAAVLGAIMVPVAVVAWLGRDRPVAPVQDNARVQTAPAAPSDSKLADRMGGEAPRPADRAPPAAPRSETPAAAAPRAGQTTAQAPGAQPDLAVAQRAVLIEENTADPQQPKISVGRALWRLDAINSGQGQPLETVVRATIEVPDAAMSLTILMRRNLDPAFPASHTIELTFAGGDPNRAVRDVGLPQLKTDETARGVPLAGLSVPVKENIFLIGLSDLKGDIERNSDLLQRRNWIDLPVRFASGQRAALSFEKGVSGERVIAEAFRQWGQP
jgi:hypothetical protein